MVQMISTVFGIRASESSLLDTSCGHKSPCSFSACPAAVPACRALGLRIQPHGINIGSEHTKMQSNLLSLLQPPPAATGTRHPQLPSPAARTQLGDRSVLKGSRNTSPAVLGSSLGTVLCFAPGPTAPAPFPSVRMQAAALQTSHLGFKPNPGLLRGCSVLCRVGGFVRLVPARCFPGLTPRPLRAARPCGRVRIWP